MDDKADQSESRVIDDLVKAVSVDIARQVADLTKLFANMNIATPLGPMGPPMPFPTGSVKSIHQAIREILPMGVAMPIFQDQFDSVFEEMLAGMILGEDDAHKEKLAKMASELRNKLYRAAGWDKDETYGWSGS